MLKQAQLKAFATSKKKTITYVAHSFPLYF